MIWKLILISVLSSSVFAAPPSRSNVEKDDLMCEVCHVIVRDMQILIEENVTQAKVEGYLNDICNRLTANQQTCLDFVKTNMASVFQKLSNGLNPQQICIQLSVCPSSKVVPPPISNLILQEKSIEKPVSNPIECELCKFVVDYLDKKLINNRSEDAINSTLTELCDQLPGALSTLCNQLKPELIKALEDEFLPEKICKEIKACTAEQARIKHNLAVSCQTCQDVLEGFLGEEGVKICSKIAGVCGKTKSQRQSTTVIDLEESEMPTTVIDDSEESEMPTGEAECFLCKFVITEVDKLIQNNQTEDNVNASIHKLCNSLPGQLQGLCESFAPLLLTAIENGLDPNMACALIKLCPGEDLEDDYGSEEKSEEFDQYDLIKETMKIADQEEKDRLKDYPVCGLCKLIIEEIDSDIREKKSPSEIRNHMFSACEKLDRSMASMCRTYVPIIIKGIVAGFDPTEACETIKLCPNMSFRPEESQQTMNQNTDDEIKAGPLCAICKLIVQDVDSIIQQNQSAAQINDTVYEFCDTLPAPLSTLCTTYAPMIIHDVISGFDPEQTCEKLQLCTNGSLSIEEVIPVNLEEKLQNVEAGPLCAICLLVVQQVDSYIQQNKSAAQINDTVYGYCAKLPAPLSTLCTTYAPMIIHDVISGFDPEQTCEKLNLCTNGSLSTEEIIPRNVEEKLQKNVEAGPLCAICLLVVQQVDSYIQQNKSAAQINDTVYGYCAKLPAPLSTLCTTYAPMIIHDVISGFDPEQTCEKLNLCTNGSLSTEEIIPRNLEEKLQNVEAGPLCAICLLVVQQVDSYIQQNKSAAQINDTVYGYCAKLPAPLSTLCTTYAPMIIHDVISGFDPEQTCEKLNLCTNGSLSTEEIIPRNVEEKLQKNVETGPLCAICELIVQEVDSFIQQNKSAAQINDTVYGLCAKLPAPLSTLCISYAPVIIHDVTAGFDPEQTCEKFKLCTNDSSVNKIMEEVKPREKNSEEKINAEPLCVLCEFVVQIIDQYLAENKTAASINGSIMGICNLLPAALKSPCILFTPQLVNIITSGVAPELACKAVKLCSMTSDDSSVNKIMEEVKPREKNSEEKINAEPLCVLCEFVVQIIDQYLAENKTAASINSSITGICNLLPGTLKSPCILFTPQLVNIITSGVAPELACKAVKLCSMTSDDSSVNKIMEEVKPREKNSEEKINAEPSCVLCEFVVQIIDQFLAENKTAASINSSIMGICNLLPATLKSPCILFTPQLVNIITSGVAPELACKAVKLCSMTSGNLIQRELPGLSCGRCHGIVEVVLPKKYSPKFGNEMCRAACPVSRQRRSAHNFQQDLTEFKKDAKIGRTWRCDLCDFIIKAVNAFVQNNATDQSLEDYMNDVCNFMPQPFKDECLKSVPEIINELNHGFDPDVLCLHYIPDECKNDTVSYKEVSEVLDTGLKYKDDQCEMCKDIISYIDSSLNHDEKEVKMYVEDVCDRMPSPTNKACKSYASAELEEILVKIINKLLTPQEVCHMIKVC